MSPQELSSRQFADYKRGDPDPIHGPVRTVENRRVGVDSTDRAYSFGVLFANMECGRNS